MLAVVLCHMLESIEVFLSLVVDCIRNFINKIVASLRIYEDIMKTIIDV